VSVVDATMSAADKEAVRWLEIGATAVATDESGDPAEEAARLSRSSAMLVITCLCATALLVGILRVVWMAGRLPAGMAITLVFAGWALILGSLFVHHLVGARVRRQPETAPVLAAAMVAVGALSRTAVWTAALMTSSGLVGPSPSQLSG